MDWNTGDTMVMTRQQATPPYTPDAPMIPEGLTGTWTGQDGDGLLFMTLEEDGRIIIAYDTPDDAVKTGTFTVSGSEFEAELPDGTTVRIRFLLTGDTLIFAGEEGGGAITLTRYHEALPTVPPAQFFPPQTLAPTALPDDPVVTPSPVSMMPTEAPPATMAPPLTEAPAATPLPMPTSAPIAQGLAGIWQGTDAMGFTKLTLTPDGRIEITYEQEAAPKRAGTYTLDSSTVKAIFDNGTAEDFRYILMGGTLLLTDAQLGNPLTMTRWDPAPQPAVAIDPALVGTWGYMEGGIYGEITLLGDGTYAKFVPEDESLAVKGTYMANGSNLAVLLPEGALQGTYALAGDGLTITWQKAEPLTFLKQSGPLVRLAQTGE